MVYNFFVCILTAYMYLYLYLYLYLPAVLFVFLVGSKKRGHFNLKLIGRLIDFDSVVGMTCLLFLVGGDDKRAMREQKQIRNHFGGCTGQKSIYKSQFFQSQRRIFLSHQNFYSLSTTIKIFD